MDFRRLRLTEEVPAETVKVADAATQDDDTTATTAKNNWASNLAFGVSIVTMLGFTALLIHAMVTRSHITKKLGLGGTTWDVNMPQSKAADEVCKTKKIVILGILGVFLAFNNCFSAVIADPSVKLDESPDASTRSLRHATVGMNAASLVMLLFYIVWYVWIPLRRRCDWTPGAKFVSTPPDARVS